MRITWSSRDSWRNNYVRDFRWRHCRRFISSLSSAAPTAVLFIYFLQVTSFIVRLRVYDTAKARNVFIKTTFGSLVTREWPEKPSPNWAQKRASVPDYRQTQSRDQTEVWRVVIEFWPWQRWTLRALERTRLDRFPYCDNDKLLRLNGTKHCSGTSPPCNNYIQQMM